MVSLRIVYIRVAVLAWSRKRASVSQSTVSLAANSRTTLCRSVSNYTKIIRSPLLPIQLSEDFREQTRTSLAAKSISSGIPRLNRVRDQEVYQLSKELL